MTQLADQVSEVRKALRAKPQTAGELADRAGYTSGRAISRALSAAVAAGEAKIVSKRPAKYARA